MGKTFDIGLNEVVTKNFDEKVFYPFKRQPRKIVKYTHFEQNQNKRPRACNFT